MTATNHALTGATIGFIVGEPFLALPLALLSHFVCDALPHFGSGQPNPKWIKSKAFSRLLISDASLCVILVLILALIHPQHWLLAAVCAFLATSPDLASINRFRLTRANKPWHPSLFSRFAGKIQWFERPIGAIVEIAWFVCGVSILAIFLK